MLIATRDTSDATGRIANADTQTADGSDQPDFLELGFDDFLVERLHDVFVGARVQRARDMGDVVLGGAEHHLGPVAVAASGAASAGTRSRPSSACSSRAAPRPASCRGSTSSACSPSSASAISNSSPSRMRRATLRMTLELSTTRQVFIDLTPLPADRAHCHHRFTSLPSHAASALRADVEHAIDVEHDQELAVEPMHAGRDAREPRDRD